MKNTKYLFECIRVLNPNFSDVGELNYWGRRIGFQKQVHPNTSRMIEVKNISNEKQ